MNPFNNTIKQNVYSQNKIQNDTRGSISPKCNDDHLIICSKDGNTQSVLAEKETGFATFLDENFSH